MRPFAQRLPFGAFAEQQRIVTACVQGIAGRQLADLLATVVQSHQCVAPHQIDGALWGLELNFRNLGERQPVIGAVQCQFANRAKTTITVGQPIKRHGLWPFSQGQ
ncbi:hypothetical protein D3C80_1930990 [compost metagenome]